MQASRERDEEKNDDVEGEQELDQVCLYHFNLFV